MVATGGFPLDSAALLFATPFTLFVPFDEVTFAEFDEGDGD